MKKTSGLFMLYLIALFSVFGMPNKTIKAQASIIDLNYFEYDTSVWDVIWYKEESFEIYTNETLVMGFVDIYSGVAIEKSNTSNQILLVSTVTRPFRDVYDAVGKQYFTGVNQNVSVTFNTVPNMKPSSDYLPVAQALSGQTNTMKTFTGNFSSAFSLTGSIRAMTALTTSGIDISVSSKGNPIASRTIRYSYDVSVGLFQPLKNRGTNLELTNDLVQTYQFRYLFINNSVYSSKVKTPNHSLHIHCELALGATKKPGWNGASVTCHPMACFCNMTFTPKEKIK